MELGSVDGENINGRHFSDFNSKSQTSGHTGRINPQKEWDAARKNYKVPSTFQISVSIPMIYGFPMPVEVSRHE